MRDKTFWRLTVLATLVACAVVLACAGCASPQVCPAPVPVQVLDTVPESLKGWAIARQHTLDAMGRVKPKDSALWGRIGEAHEYTRKINEAR